ncbi:2-succinyl-5-enolpyruvyl-6-hydroxy-3-cyclohexene-1-carboxylic-acid synthase [Thalassobacillus sp. CUG 92003]|uniref:2-succinyl-5-enolpyruvyl-6-hydroxy-3- cyclohexene-1-carboxylic-acid synthase n=1 Tax=Thalassobacillus sp. CUG 92003 TaxID=2736641 RepID=UPI0015E688CC|nr:2-succinyl-5-enolpyruvyl-6-hydroxy-3-cyclohexene-1-carboxylic-acid synthase [Thalassobacillus sp. CUG 92003]
MDHTESMTRYVGAFVDQLYQSGVTDVVISPGSRSTPLAMTCAEHSGLKEWVILDERSAGFFALGIAKEQRAPVVLICTSGTAAANYYPAIVEAAYSRHPLIVLTADRPHELRDVGAPQAIEQIDMYHSFTKWFHEMALPEGTERMLHYAKNIAARAVRTSASGNAGPVQLNFPFREPLVPDFSLPDWQGSTYTIPPVQMTGKRQLVEEHLGQIKNRLLQAERGVIVCGPQMDVALREAVIQLSDALGVPVLADPLSQLRTGSHDKENVIDQYDAILKSSHAKQQLSPEFIIRFGAMPVSKSYLQWLELIEEAEHFVVEPEEGVREPAGVPTQFIYADPVRFCYELANSVQRRTIDSDWLNLWQEMNLAAKECMLRHPEDEALNEAQAVADLSELLPDQSILFVGNSMPIREVDSFFVTTPKDIELLANRGGNGIDGVVSTALGASVSGKHVTLLIGDVSLFHDLNGLLTAKHEYLSLTVVLINNDGGGIFSYLPQARHPDHYEKLFGTPLGLDFKPIIEGYGASYRWARTKDQYTEYLRNSYQNKGVNVIEIRTQRDEHVPHHKAKWEDVKHAISELLERDV